MIEKESIKVRWKTMAKGWYNQSLRHSLASRGIETSTLDKFEKNYQENLSQILDWEKGREFDLDIVDVDEEEYSLHKESKGLLLTMPIVQVSGDEESFIETMSDKILNGDLTSKGMFLKFVNTDYDDLAFIYFEDWDEGCIPEIYRDNPYDYISEKEKDMENMGIEKIKKNWFYDSQHVEDQGRYGQYLFYGFKPIGNQEIMMRMYNQKGDNK